MSYYYFFYYSFIILFPIIAILFQLKIPYSRIYLYSGVFIVILIHYILLQIYGINWRNIDNKNIGILVFTFIPIFLNLFRKNFFYFLLLVLYIIIFLYILIFNVFINFLSERSMLLSNESIVVYMDSAGGSWSDNNGISITGKYKVGFFEKTFFQKSYQDMSLIDIQNTVHGTFAEFRTDSGILFTESIK